MAAARRPWRRNGQWKAARTVRLRAATTTTRRIRIRETATPSRRTGAERIRNMSRAITGRVTRVVEPKAKPTTLPIQIRLTGLTTRPIRIQEINPRRIHSLSRIRTRHRSHIIRRHRMAEGEAETRATSTATKQILPSERERPTPKSWAFLRKTGAQATVNCGSLYTIRDRRTVNSQP